MVRLTSRGGRQSGDLEAFFGRLELRALDVLWRRNGAASVRDVQAELPGTAYTTVMTTLDRLHRKGVLERQKEGRAFVYRPRYSREQLRLGLVRDAFGAILGGSIADRPLLSCLIDAVSQRDEALLDELERLVGEKRRALSAREPGEGQ
jgi:predicted transcriptional regulator